MTACASQRGETGPLPVGQRRQPVGINGRRLTAALDAAHAAGRRDVVLGVDA